MTASADLEPDSFVRAREIVQDFSWRGEIDVDQMPAPQKIAPHALAISAEIYESPGAELMTGNGRLIVLHDPAGNIAWEGTYRLVTFCRATVDQEMAVDPLINQVGWSWLTESLAQHGAETAAASGTVTVVVSESFGQLESEEPRAELEVRASWTALIDSLGPEEFAQALRAHLSGWQALVSTIAGLAPPDDDVIALSSRRNRPGK